MQTCAQWLRSHFNGLDHLDDHELNAAGERPPEAVYQPIGPVRNLVVHHSATDSGSAVVFRALHRGVNGWVDIGYHYVIGNGTLSGDGEIEEGRPEWAVGAHSRGQNQDTLGICLVGDFSDTSPTARQVSALGSLLEDLMSRFGLKPSDVILHRDVPGCVTECPGKNLTRRAVLQLIE